MRKLELLTGRDLRRKYAKGTVLLFLIALAAGGAACGLYFYAAAHPVWVAETFVHWSRRCVRVLNSLNGWLPFSLAECLLYLLIPSVLTVLVTALVRVCRKRRPPALLLRLVAWLLCAVCCFALFYEAIWAAGYHAQPLARSLGYEVRKYSAEELSRTCRWLRDQVNAEAAGVERDENGVALDLPFSDYARIARESWESYCEHSSYFSDYRPGTAKPVLASEAMSWADIAGIFFAPTGEANINAHAPASSIPYTVCHELAHGAMVCPENEANFAAWLVCRQSDSPLFRYSGALSAFVYTYNALVGEDRETAYALYRGLSAEVQADLAARSAYWQKYQGKIEKISNAVNNTYLQVMAQPEGVKSYGMVTDLLICTYLREHDFE